MSLQAWLPTTKKQRVLVYGLNATLFVNLMVIVVLLAGTDSTTREAEASPHKAISAPSTQPELLSTAGSAESPVVSSPAAQPALGTQSSRISSDPFVLGAPEQAVPTSVSQQPAVQPQGETASDKPLTFFGIGLDVD
ncbi:MAG: hypothetical protein AAF085_10470 [Planctomycetota bacterium]